MITRGLVRSRHAHRWIFVTAALAATIKIRDSRRRDSILISRSRRWNGHGKAVATDTGTMGLLATITTITAITSTVPATGVAAEGIFGMAVAITARSTTTAVPIATTKLTSASHPAGAQLFGNSLLLSDPQKFSRFSPCFWPLLPLRPCGCICPKVPLL